MRAISTSKPDHVSISPGTSMGTVRLTVSDVDRSRAFYERALGLRTTERDDGTVLLGADAGTALVELRGHIPNTLMLAKQIAAWSLANLRDARGFFYYQKRRFFTVKIPYMRWSQAWMLYALSLLREALEK